jgi:hypothetical protein
MMPGRMFLGPPVREVRAFQLDQEAEYSRNKPPIMPENPPAILLALTLSKEDRFSCPPHDWYITFLEAE